MAARRRQLAGEGGGLISGHVTQVNLSDHTYHGTCKSECGKFFHLGVSNRGSSRLM